MVFFMVASLVGPRCPAGVLPSVAVVGRSARAFAPLSAPAPFGALVRPSPRSFSGFVAVVPFASLAAARGFASLWGAQLPAACRGCRVRSPSAAGPFSVSVPCRPVWALPAAAAAPRRPPPRPPVWRSRRPRLPFPLVRPPSGSPLVAFSGSRSAPSALTAVVAPLVGAVSAAGAVVGVCCCLGLDSLVMGSIVSGVANVPLSGLRVFTAFGPDGAGSCSLSSANVLLVPSSCVSWWAGGSSALALSARLARRSAALVSAASALVVFFNSPRSRGSFLAASLAVSRSLPVVAFPCVGAGSGSFPSLGAGSWVPLGVPPGSPWAGGFLWSPAAGSLF